MPTWNSGALWSAGQLWGPLTTAVSFSNRTHRKQRTMPRQHFYPKNHGDQPEWHINFGTKVAGHAAALPLTQAQVDAAVADNLILGYGLGPWILGIREYGTGCTASLETLANGIGTANFAFPVFTPPALPDLPAGITGVKPGALDRTFKLVKLIKTLPGYTPEIGLDLGIIGPEAPPPPPAGEEPTPRITVTAIPGNTFQYARCKFFREGHQNVQFQCRRGNGDFEDVGQSNKSPFIDDRPLLVAGQAEIREYRARFVDDNLPTSDWCAVVKVTISP